MRILILGSYDKSLMLFRGELIRTLVSRGHEVIACAPEISTEVGDAIVSLGAMPVSTRMRRTGMGPISDLRYLGTVIKLLRRHRPQKVLAYTMKPVAYGSLAGRITGVGDHYSLVTGLGYAFTGSGLRRRVIGFFVRMLLKLALSQNSAVLFQNPDDREHFTDLGLINKNVRVSIVNGSGVDTEYYSTAPVPDSPVFLMIARLLGDKGVREYAAAARIVRKQFPECRFDLAGWLDSNPRCISQQELDGWVSDGTINFLGRLEDVRPAIRECAVFVLPSYREGTPRTNLEAMSMGRAIITTDAPGCRETVSAGRNGLLVPVGDVSRLADAMTCFLNGDCSANAMGMESRKIVENKYDVHKVNAQILECMDLSDTNDSRCDR